MVFIVFICFVLNFGINQSYLYRFTKKGRRSCPPTASASLPQYYNPFRNCSSFTVTAFLL
ncbi:hypothetical protein HMPREF1548_04062 [Clostridium sp. KLE 1755]|nr:hypothetical protein HMPREF1548_04062 [Clostridium sp. KLE 1755]